MELGKHAYALNYMNYYQNNKGYEQQLNSISFVFYMSVISCYNFFITFELEFSFLVIIT